MSFVLRTQSVSAVLCSPVSHNSLPVVKHHYKLREKWTHSTTKNCL